MVKPNTSAKKTLLLFESKRQHAIQSVAKKERQIVDHYTNLILQKDAKFAQLSKDEARIRHQLHKTRLSITKKTDGIETRKAALQEMKDGLEAHLNDEKNLVAELEAAQNQKLDIFTKATDKAKKNLLQLTGDKTGD